MDKYISIDIQVPKLLEWLISRRHCNNDWQAEVVKIRAKINAAIQDMPEHREIVNLLSGTYIHYFHCLKIIEILKETEKDSKNIFGGYTSQRMKDWQNIVSSYTKNNVYLAEAAELLINTVKYEVPSIKKLIAKQNQLENEYKKKEVDAVKSSNSAATELAALLKELGVDSSTSNYRASLVEIAKQLDKLNSKVAADMKTLQPVVDHYVEFTKFVLPNQTVDLNLIKYLLEKGNTTTFEFVKGIQPTKIELPKIAVDDSDSNEIDGIDWGYDIGSSAIEIEVIDSGESSDNPKSEEVESNDPNEIVATGDLAFSILDSASYRTNLINQLKELQMFVKIRLYECDKESSIDAILVSKQTLEEMLSKIERILDSLTNATAQHYFNILYSSKYLDDILNKIEQKENVIERSSAIVKMSKEKAKEAAQEAVALNKKGQMIVKKSKELQAEVCKDISQKYSGRKVFMSGGASI